MKAIGEAIFGQNERTNSKSQSSFEDCNYGVLEFPGLLTLDKMGLKNEAKVTIIKIYFK